MSLWRRKASTQHNSGAGALPPPPVIPWRVPPMGSMGDAWDSEIELPKRGDSSAAGGHPPVEGARKSKRPPAMKRQRFRKPAYNEVVFVEYIAPLHWCVILAWVLIAVAFFSTGPLYPIMALFALGGVMSGIAAALLLRTIHRDSKGEISAYAAICIGMALIVLDMFKPNAYAYHTYFMQAARKPVVSLEFPEKMTYTDQAMYLMASIAWCAYQIDGAKTIDIGRNSVNRSVSGDPEYFGISTLAWIDPARQLEGLGEEFVFYGNIDLPRDSFARDPRATFGVYITTTHILVYSMGPDGIWQINPRQPVDLRSPDPEGELAPHTFNRADGHLGQGDIILVIPLAHFEEMEGACDLAKKNLEELQKTGEMPRQLSPPQPDRLW